MSAPDHPLGQSVGTSNSCRRTPSRKASHSWTVKARLGPSCCCELRTRTRPSWNATSTHVSGPLLHALARSHPQPRLSLLSTYAPAPVDGSKTPGLVLWDGRMLRAPYRLGHPPVVANPPLSSQCKCSKAVRLREAEVWHAIVGAHVVMGCAPGGLRATPPNCGVQSPGPPTLEVWCPDVPRCRMPSM